jgi:hypothetical protein
MLLVQVVLFNEDKMQKYFFQEGHLAAIFEFEVWSGWNLVWM